MDAETWNALTPAERAKLRVPAIPAAYAPHVGWRVEVETVHGDTVRGIVGVSTGWAPCYLLLARRNCYGGSPAPEPKNIRRLYRVR
jgi:hypothetical protein